MNEEGEEKENSRKIGRSLDKIWTKNAQPSMLTYKNTQRETNEKICG